MVCDTLYILLLVGHLPGLLHPCFQGKELCLQVCDSLLYLTVRRAAIRGTQVILHYRGILRAVLGGELHSGPLVDTRKTPKLSRKQGRWREAVLLCIHARLTPPRVSGGLGYGRWWGRSGGEYEEIVQDFRRRVVGMGEVRSSERRMGVMVRRSIGRRLGRVVI